MGVIEILLQGSHILVASDFDDLVHRLAGSHRRSDESAPQTVATDIEIVDCLTGPALDHQVDPLWPKWLGHQLTPAVHAPKQRPFADPAFAKPVLQC